MNEDYISYQKLEEFVLEDSYQSIRRAYVDGHISNEEEIQLAELAVMYDKSNALTAIFEYSEDPWGTGNYLHKTIAENGGALTLTTCHEFIPRFLQDHLELHNPIHDFIYSNVQKNADDLEFLISFLDKHIGEKQTNALLELPDSKTAEPISYLDAILQIDWHKDNIKLMPILLSTFPHLYDGHIQKEIIKTQKPLYLSSCIDNGFIKLNTDFHSSVFHTLFEQQKVTLQTLDYVDYINNLEHKNNKIYNYIFNQFYSNHYNPILQNKDHISWALENGMETKPHFYKNIAKFILKKHLNFNESSELLEYALNEPKIEQETFITSLVQQNAEENIGIGTKSSIKQFLTRLRDLENSPKNKHLCSILEKNIDKVSDDIIQFVNHDASENLHYLERKNDQKGLALILKTGLKPKHITHWLNKVLTNEVVYKDNIFLFKNGSIQKELEPFIGINKELLNETIVNQNIISIYHGLQNITTKGFEKEINAFKEYLKKENLEHIKINDSTKDAIKKTLSFFNEDNEKYIIGEKCLLDLTYTQKTDNNKRLKI